MIESPPVPNPPPRRRLQTLLLAALLVVAAAAGAWLVLLQAEADDAGEAVIAVVRSAEADNGPLVEGMQLAQEGVNRAGGIAGRPVRLHVVQEETLSEDAKPEEVVARSFRLATRLGRGSDLLAVVGHSSSSTAVPASAIYNLERKLYIATNATATSLTNHRFDFVFALQPNNQAYAAAMARHALSLNLRRFVVLSDRSDYGTEVTKMFVTFATEGGGQILYRGVMAPENGPVDRLLLYLLQNPVFTQDHIDAIFVTSTSLEETARFISSARRLGLKMPILGPEYLYSSALERMVGKGAMNEVWTVSRFDVDSDRSATRRFVADYVARFGHEPDLLAAMGYDAVTLIAGAVRMSGSLDSAVLAETLRTMRYAAVPQEGASGRLAFDMHGMVADGEVHIVRHDGTDFRTVMHYPQTVDRGEGRAPAGTDNLLPSHKMGN